MNSKRRHKKHAAKKGFTLVEVLLAVTLFSILFAGVFQLQNSALTSFNVGIWKAESQRTLAMGLKLIRDDIEKATYPSVMFPDGTMIIDNPASPPSTYRAQDPTTAASDPNTQNISNHYLKYKAGAANTGEITPPAQGQTINLITFSIYAPIVNNASNLIMPQSTVATSASGKVTTVTISWRGPTNDKPNPAIQYRRNSNPPESMDSGARDIITHVSRVFIKVDDIVPPGTVNKHYAPYDVHALVNLKVELSSLSDNRIKRSSGYQTDVKIDDGIKARCNVRGDGSL